MADSRLGKVLAVAILTAWGMVNQAGALTIYRLGGEDRPPPAEVQRGEADFKQLSWAAVDPLLGGRTEAIAVDSAGMGPLVFGPNDNIGPTIWQRNGSVLTQGFQGYGVLKETELVVDGNRDTIFDVFGREYSEGIYGKTFLIDLGGLFAVDRVRFSPRQGFEDRVVDSFYIMTNVEEISTEEAKTIQFPYSAPSYGSGGPVAPGWVQQDMLRALNLVFTIVAEGKENQQPVVERSLPKIPIRRLVLWVPDQEKPWEIAELEIFAKGYVPEAAYVSNLIDLGASSSLGWVRWSGRQDPQAAMSIRSQSGDDEDPNLYWRKSFRGDEQVTYGPTGKPLTRRDYDKLETLERGLITHDSANWELWSAPYDFADSAGVPLVAAKPRRYVQFSVDFSSSLSQDGGRLGYLEFAVSPPAVSGLLGEISPWQVLASKVTAFTYVVRPTIEPGDRGFDGLEIEASGGRVVGVETVRIGGQAVVFSQEVEPERLVVHFPRLGLAQAGELLEVVFGGEVFRYGATFAGRVFDSEAPQEVWQKVRAGDAAEQLDGNTLVVATSSLSDQVLGQLDLSGGVFTPNGDGINDVLQISFDLLKLTVLTPVVVRVWDLAGQPVAQVYVGQGLAGRQIQEWDGRDGQGQLVRPGIYICQVEVETAEGRQTRSHLLTVAY